MLRNVHSIDCGGTIVTIRVVTLRAINGPIRIATLGVFTRSNVELDHIGVGVTMPIGVRLHRRVFLLVIKQGRLTFARATSYATHGGGGGFRVLASFVFYPWAVVGGLFVFLTHSFFSYSFVGTYRATQFLCTPFSTFSGFKDVFFGGRFGASILIFAQFYGHARRGDALVF